jgi:transcriptional regulator with GAF, ATPase, and Fis domain
VVARACHARDRLVAARSAGEHPHAIHLVGASATIQQVQQLIERVATSDATVLVLGESGTGKELVARAVHYASLRADGPMVRVNAGALAPGLLESELFGHVKGAFTGAIEDRPGLFALADRGTLFLDEVGELAPETQVKLLRILESGEYLPVGGREVRRCDVRIVAATNRDLEAQVRDGAFREDLYYRLAVVPIVLPPLRERREDIPLLAGHLLSRHAVKLRRGVTGFAAEALLAMESWPWPGNIRELDNRIQRGVALTPEGLIQREALFGLDRTPAPAADRPGDDPEAGLRAGGTLVLEAWLQDQERRMLAAAIAACDGNLTAAAERLGLTFRQIRYKVRQLGMR